MPALKDEDITVILAAYRVARAKREIALAELERRAWGENLNLAAYTEGEGLGALQQAWQQLSAAQRQELPLVLAVIAVTGVVLGARVPIADLESAAQLEALEKNAPAFGIRYIGDADVEQGIVHVVGPQLGLTQPGMTIVCGDSHTATHGAFGALAASQGTMNNFTFGDDTRQYYETLCGELGAAPVQHIGNVLVVFRENPPAPPAARDPATAAKPRTR